MRSVQAPGTYRPPDSRSYAYLLGVYLGDGSIWQTGPNSWRLEIACDALYPNLVEEISRAIRAALPDTMVRANQRSDADAVTVCASSDLLPLAFPQLGRGHEHERHIALELWQLAITLEHPRELLRGLIHSDGCRTLNRFRTRLPSGRIALYEYPRYFFSNESGGDPADLLRSLRLPGIRWTRSNRRNISVSHRESVAVLDTFIGPKS